MKENKKRKKLSKWSVGSLEVPILAKILLLGAFIACLGIMILYVINVGSNISNKPENWGFFGALLSGTFGMLASFAAVATLLIVIQQFKSQDEITKKQIDSIEFDRYDRHRRIFFEKLKNIEDLYDNEIEILNKEKLYHTVFPNNSPLRCEIKIEASNYGDNEGINIINNAYMGLVDELSNKESMPERIIAHLVHIRLLLTLHPKGPKKNGEINLHKKREPINMYTILRTLKIYTQIYNDILEYTGNSHSRIKLYPLIKGTQITRNFIAQAHRLKKKEEEGELDINCSDELLDAYEKLYIFLIKKEEKISDAKLETLLKEIENIITDEVNRKALRGPLANTKKIEDRMRNIGVRNSLDDVEQEELNYHMGYLNRRISESQQIIREK